MSFQGATSQVLREELQFVAANESNKPAASPWQQLLPVLLNALGWRGELRQIEDVLLPHDVWNMENTRTLLAHLGFDSRIRKPRLPAIDTALLPVVIVDRNGEPHMITSLMQLTTLPKQLAYMLVFDAAASPAISEGVPSLGFLMGRFAPLLNQVVLMSLLVGALALVPTFYNMAVYDHIIGAGTTRNLSMLVAGALLALGAEVFFRHLRNKSLGYFGARIDHFASCLIFERLMYLPPVFTERSAVAAQLARLRDFESVREFFTGPLAGLFFEMPLVTIYIIVMAVISGWLAMVPVVLVGCYCVLIALVNGHFKKQTRASASATSARHEFVMETVTRLHDIRLSGLETVWQQRFSELSRKATMTHFRAALSAQALETASYVLMTLGGVATLGFGVTEVIEKQISVGALVGCMMLIWRIITPVQMATASFTRLQQLGASTRQIQRLLAAIPEHLPYTQNQTLPALTGKLTFHRVSMRYQPDSEPALLGLSFEAQPGQVITIRGGNGSGKSSVLKLALGLYTPQSGSVRLDGVDIRQLDPIALRQAVAYVPQQMDFFPGTIRDNLLFANPTVSDDDLAHALHTARAYDQVRALPDGLDTIVAGDAGEQISFMLKQRLNLARAYLRPAKVFLFDEASHLLGRDNDEAFAQVIANLRGKATVLIVTHREDHMRLGDVLLVLNKGELTHAGPPDQVLAALKKQ